MKAIIKRDFISSFHNVTGWLFPAGDSAALIDRAERLLRLDPEAREAMGRAARQKMERQFDREIVISRYIQEAEQ